GMFTAPGNGQAIGHGAFEDDADYFPPPLRGCRNAPTAANLPVQMHQQQTHHSSNSVTFRSPSRSGTQPSSADSSVNPTQLPISQPADDSPNRAQDHGEPTASKVTEATM